MKPQTKLAIMFSIALLLIQPCNGFSANQVRDKERQTQLSEIIVTANKVEEDLQDVPQSISVIGEVELDEKGIKDIPAIIREIPNMNIEMGSYLGRAVNFRGLNASVFTNSNPVVIYIDGIPIADRHVFDASLVNVERVEVLRGPQGTLYGKDAIGGVINIVSKKSDNEWHGKIGAEYGSNNYMQLSFNASGSVIDDKLFLGINGQYQQDDGWIENIHEGMDSNADQSEARRLGAYLLYTPTERFSARLSLSNVHYDNSWEKGYALPSGSGIELFDRDNAETVNFDVPTNDENDNLAESIGLNYEFDSVTLSSITTHQMLKLDGKYDADFMAGTDYDGCAMFTETEMDTYTQEFRLASNNDTGIRWIGGLYFEHENREQDPYGQSFPYYNNLSVYLGIYENYSASKTKSETYAAFGQAMIPFMDRFELTLGGRYQHIKKDMDADMYFQPEGVSSSPSLSLSLDKTWNTFLPKAALSYRASDDWNVYASYSQGHMPGGFNYFPSSDIAKDNTFKPQQSRNYEIGIKGEVDRFHITAALFYMDIKDIHVYKSTNEGMYYTDNAESAHSTGAEIEMGYRLTDTIDLSASVGIISAKYDDYDAGGGTSFDDKDIQNTPSYTANAGISYIHPNGLYSRMDVKMVGDVHYFDDANNSFSKADSYTTFDAKIGYLIGNFDLYVYGKNISDEEYVVGYFSAGPFALIDYGDPLTVGVGVRYQF